MEAQLVVKILGQKKKNTQQKKSCEHVSYRIFPVDDIFLLLKKFTLLSTV